MYYSRHNQIIKDFHNEWKKDIYSKRRDDFFHWWVIDKCTNQHHRGWDFKEHTQHAYDVYFEYIS